MYLLRERQSRFGSRHIGPEWFFLATQLGCITYALSITGLVAGVAGNVPVLSWTVYLLAVTPLSIGLLVIGMVLTHFDDCIRQFGGLTSLAAATGLWFGWTLAFMSLSMPRIMFITVVLSVSVGAVAVPLFRDSIGLVVGFLAVYTACVWLGLRDMLVDAAHVSTMVVNAEWALAGIFSAGAVYVLFRSTDMERNAENAVASAASIFRDPLILIGRMVCNVFRPANPKGKV